MILSRFFHKVELDNNIYAIFNSLMMDILYVDDKKLNEILDFNWNVDNNKLDYSQIERMSQIWSESELDSILYDNAFKYYKLNK